MKPKYYAHSHKMKSKDQWQLLKNHLLNTADLASMFAISFGANKIAYLAGLIHDIGKYSLEFQKRLEGQHIKVDHSTPGAVEAEKWYGPVVRYWLI